MTIEELRALAAYHKDRADAARQCANQMGACPVAEKSRAAAAIHATWAQKLIDLADSFYAFTASQ